MQEDKAEDKTYSGKWWLPGNPEIRTHGDLHITATNELTLELQGLLGTDGSLEAGLRAVSRDVAGGQSEGVYEIILGQAVTGEPITLYNCFSKLVQPRYPGETTQSVNVNRAFFGIHFQSAAEMKFKQVYVRLTHLDEWFAISGFDVKGFLGQSEPLTITYKKPGTVEVGKVDDYTLSIGVSVNGPTQTIVQTQVKMTQEAVFVIEAETGEKSFTGFSDVIHRLERLICLAAVEPIYPLYIHGHTDRSVFTLSNGKSIHNTIDIHCPLIRDPYPRKQLQPQDMLFRWPDVRSDAAEFIHRWFAICDKFDRALDCFFAVRYMPDTYLDLRFLSLAHALEVYHRCANRELYKLTPEHIQRLKSIHDCVGPVHWQWLRRKLGFSHHLGMSERVQYIVDTLAPVAEMFIRDRSLFATKVKNTRNYFTHFSTSLREKAAKEEELLWLVEKMEKLLEACFLHELGFGNETICERVKGWQIDQLREKGSC